MRKAAYVLVPVFIALALRLYPTLISGMPFSTDAWAPIRNTELLLEHTPIPLNDKIFDGYNNYWPANSLFGAVISEVTSISPMEAMSIFSPIIGASTVLIFFVLVKRLFGAKISFVASVIFGTAFAHVFFTAGVTKETYANPIYLLLIFVFLHPAIGKSRQVLLFSIASVSLVLAHHFTSLIALFILSSIALARFVHDTKKGLASNKFDFVLVLIPVAATFLYYGIYAQAGFAVPFSFSDWLSVASFQLLAFALAIYAVSRPVVQTNPRILVTGLVTVAAIFLFVLLTLSVTLVPTFTPAVQRQVFLFVLPYFIALSFITLGYAYRRSNREMIAPLFWLATFVGLQAYAVFSNSSQSIVLWVRTPNFLWVPVAILSAVGLCWVYERAGGYRVKKLIKPTVAVIVVFMATVNVYGVYAAVSLEDRYLGYHWLYRTEEFKAGAWIAATGSGQTVAGDMKVSYLMQDYFQTDVDELLGFRYLATDSESKPSILFIYSQMLANGYVLGIHGADLPENWTEKAFKLNLVYSNGYVSLCAR